MTEVTKLRLVQSVDMLDAAEDISRVAYELHRIGRRIITQYELPPPATIDDLVRHANDVLTAAIQLKEMK